MQVYNDIAAAAYALPSVGGSAACRATIASGHAEIGRLMSSAVGPTPTPTHNPDPDPEPTPTPTPTPTLNPNPNPNPDPNPNQCGLWDESKETIENMSNDKGDNDLAAKMIKASAKVRGSGAPTPTPTPTPNQVIFDAETREIDYNDVSITENTRCAYPLQARRG